MGIDNEEKGKTKEKLNGNSAKEEHLIENQNCFVNYDVNRFKIVSKARNDFNLRTLEQGFPNSFTKSPPFQKFEKKSPPMILYSNFPLEYALLS